EKAANITRPIPRQGSGIKEQPFIGFDWPQRPHAAHEREGGFIALLGVDLNLNGLAELKRLGLRLVKRRRRDAEHERVPGIGVGKCDIRPRIELRRTGKRTCDRDRIAGEKRRKVAFAAESKHALWV